MVIELPLSIKLDSSIFDLTWIFATAHNAVAIFLFYRGFLLYRHWFERTGDENFYVMPTNFYSRRIGRLFPGFF